MALGTEQEKNQRVQSCLSEGLPKWSGPSTAIRRVRSLGSANMELASKDGENIRGSNEHLYVDTFACSYAKDKFLKEHEPPLIGEQTTQVVLCLPLLLLKVKFLSPR